jgi:hypothetical protein
VSKQQPIPQYYHKNGKCIATPSTTRRCICWHDEGTGPFPDERSDSDSTQVIWRNNPKRVIKEQSCKS